MQIFYYQKKKNKEKRKEKEKEKRKQRNTHLIPHLLKVCYDLLQDLN